MEDSGFRIPTTARGAQGSPSQRGPTSSKPGSRSSRRAFALRLLEAGRSSRLGVRVESTPGLDEAERVPACSRSRPKFRASSIRTSGQRPAASASNAVSFPPLHPSNAATQASPSEATARSDDEMKSTSGSGVGSSGSGEIAASNRRARAHSCWAGFTSLHCLASRSAWRASARLKRWGERSGPALVSDSSSVCNSTAMECARSRSPSDSRCACSKDSRACSGGDLSSAASCGGT